METYLFEKLPNIKFKINIFGKIALYISLNQLSPNSLGNFSEFVLTVCLDEKAVAVPEII